MREKTKKKAELTKAEKKAFALVGRRGGKATFAKRGREHMSEIGRKGAKKRWSSKKSNKLKK